MKRRSFFLLPFAATTAGAHSLVAGEIKIGHAWALPGIVGQDGQAFMPLLNTGKEAEAMVAARSDACSFIEFRYHAKYDILAPRQMDLLPGRPIAMRPQAVHLRLGGLNHDLKLGDRLMFILDFLNQGEVEIEVHVENAPGD
jgi:periplasmic copper chaperone A